MKVLGVIAFWTEKAGDPALAIFLSAVFTLCRDRLLDRRYPEDEFLAGQARIDIDQYIQNATDETQLEQALSLASDLLNPVPQPSSRVCQHTTGRGTPTERSSRS